MTSTEKLDREAALSQLRWCLEHVPPSVNNGSYNFSVDFKAAVTKARRIYSKTRSTTFELTQSVGSFEKFWRTA